MDSYIKTQDVMREIRKLNIDRKYLPIAPHEYFKADYNIFISTRECAKTTETLIVGLILYKLYGTTTEYLRCDNDQTRRAVIEPLYNVIRDHHYIEVLFPRMWNDMEYSQTKKAFTLIARDGEGAIIKRDIKPFCFIHSNESWQNIKSGYNSPKGDFIVFDEIFDSHRATLNQVTELWNNISTIGRVNDETRSPNVHCIMLGNNSDLNSFWWDELGITEEIRGLKSFGESFDTITELGTSVYFHSLDITTERKNNIKNNKIRFFGFNTKRAAQFTGMSLWSTKDYQHIPDNEMLNPDFKVSEKIFIKHREKYIQLVLYYNKDNQYYVYCHWAYKPLYNDRIVLTLNPIECNEFYGTADLTTAKNISIAVRKLICLRKENRWYYQNNTIGNLIDDYLKNC